MGFRSVIDPWTNSTYSYEWNQAEDPSPEQEMAILEKERQRRKVQPPPRVDADSLLSRLSEPAPSIVSGLRREPEPIEPPQPDLLQRMKDQPTLGSAVKFGLSAAMDPVGAATGNPEWSRDIVGDLIGPPDEPTDTSNMDPGTAFLARSKDVLKRMGRTTVEKALPLASSPISGYFAVPGAAASIPGRLAAGAFGAQAARGGGEALGQAQALVDAGKDWSDPEVVDLLTSAGIDLTAAPFMLRHGASGLQEIASHPTVVDFAKFANPMREGPLGREAGVLQFGDPLPPEWLAEQGYRKVKGIWRDKNGSPVTAPQIFEHFNTGEAPIVGSFKSDVLDKPIASTEVRGRVVPEVTETPSTEIEMAPVPKPKVFKTRAAEEIAAPEPWRNIPPTIRETAPTKQLGFEEWRSLPENRKFYGGKLSPERMKTALTDYNNYATEFASKKASTTVSKEPLSVEEAMGDVGEIPLEFGEEKPLPTNVGRPEGMRVSGPIKMYEIINGKRVEVTAPPEAPSPMAALDEAIARHDVEGIRQAGAELVKSGEVTTHDISDLMATADYLSKKGTLPSYKSGQTIKLSADHIEQLGMTAEESGVSSGMVDATVGNVQTLPSGEQVLSVELPSGSVIDVGSAELRRITSSKPSVQPVNELASPELQSALAEATREMTELPPEFKTRVESLPPPEPGKTRIWRAEGAEQKAGGGWAAQNPAEAASYLKGHWGKGATGEGRLLHADIPDAALDAIAARRGVSRVALGELTPEELAQFAPEWRDVAAKTTEISPIETVPEPTGSFETDVLKQPVPEETVGSTESVQRGAGTILPEPSKAPVPSQPESIVPSSETIVQEPLSKPPAQPEAPQVAGPVTPPVQKLALDSLLEELYPGKDSFTKKDIQAARKELMSRLRGKKGEKAAAKTEALHQAVEAEVPPGTTPPAKVAKGAGEAPKLPLGSPGLISRVTLDLRTNLGKVHPHLAKWVDKFQREAELPAMNAIAERRTITEGLSGKDQQAILRILDEKGAEELAVARELKDQPKIKTLLQQDPTLKNVWDALEGNPKLIEKAADLRDLLDSVHKAAEKNKVAVGYRQHYFPHYFKEGGFRPNVQPRATPRTGTMTRRMSKLEKQRLTMRKDYIKDLNVLDEYFMQAYQRISEAENFGKRHEKIAKWFEQTQGVDPRVAQYFDKAIQRITGNEEPSWIRGALGKSRRIQALTDLGLAAPLQLGQVSHVSAYGGVMKTLEAAKDMTRGQREIAMRALRGGALTPDIGIESLGAARGGGVTSGRFLWGIPTMDKAMRVHAFRVGELLHRDAVAGNAGAIRSLSRLGIKDISKITADQVGTALSNKTQFKTGFLDLPLWSTSPLGRTATMYTSFMYQHTKFVGQMFKNPVQNAPAIARFALIGALAGEGVGDIRAVLRGRNPVEDEKFRRKEAKWIDVLRNRRIPWSDPVKRMIQNYALLGGVGIFQTYFERLNAPDVTLTGIAGGPVASNVEELIRDVARPKRKKEKIKAAGRWGLQQTPVFGYDIGEAILPPRRRSVADPLMDVE